MAFLILNKEKKDLGGLPHKLTGIIDAVLKIAKNLMAHKDP